MHYEMKFGESIVMVKDVRIESGVLMASIIAKRNEEYLVFIKKKEKKIIVAGSYQLEECDDKIFESLDSYLNTSLEFEL